MKQDKFSGDWGNRQRNAILLVMVTILIIYIAVPIYGVIQDTKEDGAVFVIEGTGAGEGNDLLDQLIDFLFHSDEVKVRTAYAVDLKGVVITSDNAPYVNGIVELRSTPRYTRTDRNGYFIFRSVETGMHRISVIDESGNILATCDVDLASVRDTSNLVTTSFSDNIYRINVSVNVRVLEIKISLKTDSNGNVQGIASLDVVKADTVPVDQQDGSVTGPSDVENPQKPDTGNEEKPGDSEEPEDSEEPGGVPAPPGSGGKGSLGGGGGGPSGPNPLPFGVYDNSAVSFGSTAAAQVNIFGMEKRIAPGMKGSYRFTVDNSRNNHRSRYTIDFTKVDTLPSDLKIPMVFRLKEGDHYVAGDAATWHTTSELNQDTSIAERSKIVYTLEWYWPESANDDLYSKLDRNMAYSCTLRIEVTAQDE